MFCKSEQTYVESALAQSCLIFTRNITILQVIMSMWPALQKALRTP